MEMLSLFGSKLAELTGQKSSVGVGMLCLSITDAGKTPQQMGYLDFKEVISQHLPKRLANLGVSDHEQVVQEMMTLLNQKQAVFTMTAR